MIELWNLTAHFIDFLHAEEFNTVLFTSIFLLSQHFLGSFISLLLSDLLLIYWIG